MNRPERAIAPTNPATIQRMSELREQYKEFFEECRHDLDPIEAEYGGIPSFAEWPEDIEANIHI